MKIAAPSRRDRLRQMLADLHMPGALEALDAILHRVDGATLTAARRSSSWSTHRFSSATTDAYRPRCAPVACRS